MNKIDQAAINAKDNDELYAAISYAIANGKKLHKENVVKSSTINDRYKRLPKSIWQDALEEAQRRAIAVGVKRKRSWLTSHKKIWKAHLKWLLHGDAPHPAQPIVKICMEYVDPETSGKAYSPVIKAGIDYPERILGMQFGGLILDRDLTKYKEIPVLKQHIMRDRVLADNKRVPILDIVTGFEGKPIRARRGGAPIELRMLFKIMATVRPQDRANVSTRLALKFSELRDGLYAHRKNGRWHATHDKPRLLHAIYNAKELAISDGYGRWWPVALRSMPHDPRPDDMVVIDVSFPPGAVSGPEIDLPSLDEIGMISSPRWRATIAAHSIAWRMGVTRIFSKKKGRRWLWATDPSKYEVLTVEDRRRLAFGHQDVKYRSAADIDAAWADLPGLVLVDDAAVDKHTKEEGWLIIPETAANVLKNKA